jgi:predicted Zn-dependent protease
MQQMGIAAYTEMKQQTPATTNGKKSDYVQCVTDHILRAMSDADPSSWEITVFEDAQANAFALPGRKIGVYTGLLDVAENQDQLATVIGHEVAHVLANHSNERVSTSTLTQTGLQLGQIAAGGGNSATQKTLFGLLGLGAQVGIALPFGRTQESEADLLGLDLMAKAGFDPRQSVYLWENMGKAGGQKPPEFMSTHPSGARRISDLGNRMNSAMALSLEARKAGKRPACK